MPVYVDYNNFERVAGNLDRRARVVVQKTIADLHREVDTSFTQEKHGRTYIVGGTAEHPIEHTASAPGEAPAVDTGNLMNSVSHTMTGTTVGEVAVGAEYGAFLELGTSRMAPRPYLGPATDKVKPAFERALGQVFNG